MPHGGACGCPSRVLGRLRRLGLGLALICVLCVGVPPVAVCEPDAGGAALVASAERSDGDERQNQEEAATLTPLGDAPEEIALACADLVEGYRAKAGHYPWRFWPANYLLLGLDPIYWFVGVRGVRYMPDGAYVGLVNVERDGYQLYVSTLDGQVLVVEDGRAIWVSAEDQRAYWRYRPGEVAEERLILVDLATVKSVQTQ